MLSIFFSDLQGFTSISERLSPKALTVFLNEYLSAMTRIIHEEGGTIDKYEGDAFSFRELGCIRVSGRKDPVTVFEPMPGKIFSARKDLFEAFYRGLNLFYKGNFDEAITYFSTIEDVDPAAEAYAAKCRSLSESPPADWDGVWSLTEK